MELNDEQLIRYSRQIFLPEIDVAGQAKLMQSRVLIIGAGGLGSISAPLLCAAGVGSLTVVDDDVVEISNLPRQIAYTENDLEKKKVDCLADRLKQMNEKCKISTYSSRLKGDKLIDVIKQHDLVLDGTDNFASRHLHNKVCFKAGKPLLSAAVSQFFGQLALFDYQKVTPCYDCLYPETSGEENNCAENGVLGPASSMVASMQALEAIKWLAIGESSILHSLLSLNMKTLQWHQAKIAVDPKCGTCMI